MIKSQYGYAIFWAYILGYQLDIRLSSLLAWTFCKLFFSKITWPFPQKSHECALKLTDLWNTSLLFDLNYKFELIGASLLALAKSIYYCRSFFTLVAASISYFPTAATKCSCCSSNKKMSPLSFISHPNCPSLLFSLSFAGPSPTFSFSLFLSLSFCVFHICGHEN